MRSSHKESRQSKGVFLEFSKLALASILLLVSTSIAADDVSFNALIKMGKNAERQGRIAVSGRSYRLEVQQDAQTISETAQGGPLELVQKEIDFTTFEIDPKSGVIIKVDLPPIKSEYRIIGNRSCEKVNYEKHTREDCSAKWDAKGSFITQLIGICNVKNRICHTDCWCWPSIHRISHEPHSIASEYACPPHEDGFISRGNSLS